MSCIILLFIYYIITLVSHRIGIIGGKPELILFLYSSYSILWVYPIHNVKVRTTNIILLRYVYTGYT